MLHSHYYLPELARIKSYLQSTSTEKYLEKHNKKLRPLLFLITTKKGDLSRKWA